ncbi:leucine--tRNA ligase [Candidatus Saccharibacteria bacterium RIFCSPHIGHO2_12_FULL_41_12]|nr:MAG: leucine--tRNA ligase [Candidatus Saccharibacteria bacterium RIFCSPHIGHO2_12_FULL_41_12]
MRYNPKDIEPKWQKLWEEKGTYKADLNSSKPKYIAMSMFNYPSGAGIHIGHAMNYTISDVKARFKRQNGYESYHPVGWDAFGLPAENYAIKAGVSPQKSMATIIPKYHKQYRAMGWSNDWSKEISTHTPEYYKWTQWIFSQMYKNGLAYQDARMQWWCEKCQTVLANEQVIDGKCWRHDGSDDPTVEKKEVKQWFFKITEYADELLDSIDGLDWTESVKLAQKNWIGKSVGADIDFKIWGGNQSISVFTTRADTLFSAAFIVLAPEHDLVNQITSSKNKPEVEAYQKAAQLKSEIERQAVTDKEKSGVFTGAYAVNPANDEKIPIWVGDFVLAGYGTGAVFGDIHDERDFQFINKFNIPAKVTVIPEDLGEAERVKNKEYSYTKEGVLIDSGKFSGMRSEIARDAIIQWLSQNKVATEKVNYKMRDWSVSRQRYWGAPIPIINCEKCGTVLVPDDQLPVVLPELEDFQPSGDGRSALARAKDWLTVDCPKCGKKAERETDTLDTYICSSWYMYRYFDPKNDEKIFDSDVINHWMPIDFYNGGDHATAHLLYARFIARFFTKIGIVDNPEPFKHMLFNGKVTASDGSAFSKSKGNGVDPLEIIEQGYGADALRTYLMFAAPLEFGARWDPQGVPGAYRFLSRLWTLVQEYLGAKKAPISQEVEKELLRITHSTIKKMSEDIEANRYNTAIAAAMGGVNALYKLKTDALSNGAAWKTALEATVACVAPFAPHIADELWAQLGNESSVQIDSWPKHNDRYIVTDKIKIVVQINGKLRGMVEASKDTKQKDLEELTKNEENVAKHLQGKTIKKVIYVPGKLINFVV